MNLQRIDTRRHHADFSALWYASPLALVVLALAALQLVDDSQDTSDPAPTTSQPELSSEVPTTPQALPVPANVARLEPGGGAASAVVATRAPQPEAEVNYEEESHVPTF